MIITKITDKTRTRDSVLVQCDLGFSSKCKQRYQTLYISYLNGINNNGKVCCRNCSNKIKSHNHYKNHTKQTSEEIKEKNKQYHQRNKEYLNKKCRQNHTHNKESINKKKKKNSQQPENIVRRARLTRERRKTDIQFYLQDKLRSRILCAVQSPRKPGSAVTDLGCTIGELKTYFETLFTDGMSWENRGRGSDNKKKGWEIDHIIPLSSFDLENREEFLKACHYTNLQPLWSEDNLKKGSKILDK